MSASLIRSKVFPALAVGIVLLSFGCAKAPSTESSSDALTTAQNEATPSIEMAREAAQIAVAIEKDPESSTEILAAHDMTQEVFLELIYKIAQDPELTEAYEAARTGSSS